MEATEEGQTGGEGTLADRNISRTLHLADTFTELLPWTLVRVVLDDLTGQDHRLTPGYSNPVALFGRAEIPQATGMIAVQLGVTIPEALAHLRADAFAAHRPILDIAQDVIARRMVFSHDWR